jgi:outer membrane receptor protein involved in Fe transport
MNKLGMIGTLAALILIGGGAASGQSSKGILAGTVRDKTGAVVAKAKVTVISQDTGETRMLTATSLGSYRAEGINPGQYEVRVEMAGFASADVKDVTVTPSVVTTFDPVLAVGGAVSTVTVEADTNEINTDNGHLSGTVGATELKDIPIFSLNPFELVATLEGVQLVNPYLLTQFGEGSDAGNYEQLIVNGARPRSNNYMLDGQDINDVGIGGQSFQPQVPDMYQSITVLLNSSAAEYGRSGGAVVNLVTKSGTNHFHGTGFELYSGSGLSAIDGVTRQGKPFPAGTNPKARYDEHQFGFTAGGPLWRDKLFAFGGTQFSRFYGTSSSSAIYLPDAAGYAELTAIAGTSATAKTQIALLQGLLNSGSYLTSYQDIGAGTSLKVSAPNCPGGAATCNVTLGYFQRPPVSQQQPDTQWMYRIDFIPRSVDTFTFRYLHDRSNFTPDLGLNTSGLPGFDGQVGGPTELGQGTWTHVLTPHLVNELRASEVRLNTQFSATPQTLANPLSKNYNVTLAGSGINELGVSQNIPQGRIQELYQFQDAVGWTRGRHSIRLGADIGRDHETDLIAQNALGALTFAGGTAASLNNFVNNALGSGGTITRSFGPTRVDPHLWKLAGFLQDDIKLTSEFTLNVGIRYDYDTNPENALAYPAVSLSNVYAPISTVVPVKADMNNLAPRIGFAFNPHEGIFADGKTVFHGGFGVFYDLDFTNILINAAQSSPNAPSTTITSTATVPVTNPAAALAAATATLTPQSSVLSVASTLVNPVTYQYNFGVERALPAQIKMTVNYVGARGEKLFANQQLNEYYNGARLNTARGAITVRDNGGDSNYNSGQLEVSRSFTHGLFFRATYTYSKNLDDASEVFSVFSNPDTSYQANLGRIAQDYGNSAWDRRHVASFAYVYAPEGFHSSNFAANLMLEAFTRHFIISGTTQLASGPYSDVQILGIDTNNDENPYNDRPLVGNPHASINSIGIDGVYLGGTPGVYYDLAANNSSSTVNILNVVNPSQVRYLIPYGTQYTTKEVGRNSFENPGQVFWNMAAEKDIPTKFRHFENAQFVLRVECQDVGNHNNVSVLDTNLLDVGTPAFMNTAAARENTSQNFRLWGKFVF